MKCGGATPTTTRIRPEKRLRQEVSQHTPGQQSQKRFEAAEFSGEQRNQWHVQRPAAGEVDFEKEQPAGERIRDGDCRPHGKQEQPRRHGVLHRESGREDQEHRERHRGQLVAVPSPGPSGNQSPCDRERRKQEPPNGMKPMH